MSTEENSNNIESVALNQNNTNNINSINNITSKINTESIKDLNNQETYDQKIKSIKKNLKILLQKTLGKSLLTLETNNQSQLQQLTITTKSYKEFNNKINMLQKQVEENLKKKEDAKKAKKIIKVSKAKFRSRTTQKGNSNIKIKDFSKTLTSESSKSLNKIRAKTTGRNDIRIQNSEKKSIKNKNNISIKVETNSGLNHTLKLNKSNSNKFNLTENNNNKIKKKINSEMNSNMNSNKLSSTNIKERKNSKKNLLRNNNNKTKINVIQKSQYDLKSNSNLLSDSKERNDKEKNNNKKLLINRKNMNLDYRKSFDYSNRKIPKSNFNTNYVKKNTENLTEKKSSSKKNYLKKNSKTKIINNNNIQNEPRTLKTEDDMDKIFQERRAILEKMKKQREETIIKEEEKKKEFEKEKAEVEKLEEERKKRELELKRKEEERKKLQEEEERKKDEERRKKQMEIEAEIEREKIEKENIRKELEKEKELERKKKLEEEEEKIKKEEMEKLEQEMNNIQEEKIEELPINIELNIEKNSNYNEENKKNKEMNIQDLLELEEKNDQNFEYFHIKEEEEIKKDNPLNVQEEKKEEKKEEKNIIEINNDNAPINLYRNISILELIHDADKFSPILFQFLSLKDLLEFTSISKKIKRQRIYTFNLQKKVLLNNIGFEDENNLSKKIKEYEENYTNIELNEPYVEYHLSRGAARAIQVLNGSTYSKIFRRPVLDSNLSQIYIAYKILFVFLGEINIAKITDDKIFWVKCTEYLNSKSDNGKIGDFIMSKFEKYNCDSKTVYYIEQLMKGKKDNISPSYFSKMCGSTGLLIFLIKELLEYCGVIISTKKTQLSRIYQNLIFFKNIIDKLSEFNETLENFN